MQSAATGGIESSSGFGRTAFAHSATILPGVSDPSSVVRSIERIARSSAHSFDSRLIERFASEAARSSRAIRSTAVVRRTMRPASRASRTGLVLRRRSISAGWDITAPAEGRSS
jgi:hypothetical protein